ncbi:unnamed protein product, partial [Prorocentrum cordatum]
MAAPGEVVLDRYDLPGPPLWHERIILAVAPQPGCFAVLTPDEDIFVEHVRVDLAEFRRSLGLGGAPEGIAAIQIYRCPAVPTPEEMMQGVRDGALQAGVPLPAAPVVPVVGCVAAGAAPAKAATAVGAHLGPAPAPQPALAAAVLPGVAAAVAVLPGPGLPLAVGALGGLAPHVWVAAEDILDIAKGTQITALPPDALVAGDRGVMPWGAGYLLVRRMPEADVCFVHDGLRVLPVTLDAPGERNISFAEAVSAMGPTPPRGCAGLDGPAITDWQLKQIRDDDSNPNHHHERWVRLGRIPEGDRSVHEHQVLCRIVDAAVTYDQLNLPSMEWAEIVCRRMSLMKEAHRAATSNPDCSAGDVFMGWGSQAAGGGTNPALAQHAAGQLKDQAAIAKESRKAPPPRPPRELADPREGTVAQALARMLFYLGISLALRRSSDLIVLIASARRWR